MKNPALQEKFWQNCSKDKNVKNIEVTDLKGEPFIKALLGIGVNSTLPLRLLTPYSMQEYTRKLFENQFPIGVYLLELRNRVIFFQKILHEN